MELSLAKALLNPNARSGPHLGSLMFRQPAALSFRATALRHVIVAECCLGRELVVLEAEQLVELRARALGAAFVIDELVDNIKAGVFGIGAGYLKGHYMNGVDRLLCSYPHACAASDRGLR